MRTKTIDRQQRDWYQLNRHRKRAKHQLAIEPFCAFCARDGRSTLATIADHVEPHHGDWLSFRIGKLQSLCKPCHDRTKRRLEMHGFTNAVGADGLPIDHDHPIYRTPQFKRAS